MWFIIQCTGLELKWVTLSNVDCVNLWWPGHVLSLSVLWVTETSTAGSHHCHGSSSYDLPLALATESSPRRYCTDVPWSRGVFRGCGRATISDFWAARSRCDTRRTHRHPSWTAERPSPGHPAPLCCSQCLWLNDLQSLHCQRQPATAITSHHQQGNFRENCNSPNLRMVLLFI